MIGPIIVAAALLAALPGTATGGGGHAPPTAEQERGDRNPSGDRGGRDVGAPSAPSAPGAPQSSAEGPDTRGIAADDACRHDFWRRIFSRWCQR